MTGDTQSPQRLRCGLCSLAGGRSTRPGAYERAMMAHRERSSRVDAARARSGRRNHARLYRCQRLPRLESGADVRVDDSRRGRQDNKRLPAKSRNHAGKASARCESQDEKRQNQPKLRIGRAGSICWPLAANIFVHVLAIRQLAHLLFVFPFTPALAPNCLTFDCELISAPVIVPCARRCLSTLC